jgi:hypothetical protein
MRFQSFPPALIVLIVVIALINMLATSFYWYWRIRWFDMPMHFLGGLWIAGSVLWFRFFSHELLSTPRSFIPVVFIGVFSAFLVGLGWEMYEASVSFSTLGYVNEIPDTISDLCFDILGGLVASVVVWVSLKK